MSESLLRIILELFAVIAKEDGVTDQERKNVAHFLRNHVSDVQRDQFLEAFDQFAEQKRERDRTEEKSEIDKICVRINQELTRQQKVVLLLDLIELILSDENISPAEKELLYEIGEGITIPSDLISVMINYVQHQEVSSYKSPEILLVHEGSQRVDSSVKEMIFEDIEGYLSFLYVSDIESYFVKYRGAPGLYMNGAPLRANAVIPFPPGSAIRSDRLPTLYYSDVVSCFIEEKESTRLVFEAEHIYFHFPGGKTGLRDISLIETAGNMVGLMGASGAGKSTLLNVLNGLEKPSQGAVTVNGIDIHRHPKEVEGVIGYVPQDDLLIEELSVFENLYYAARLCFSQASRDELEQLVTKTLRDLGLLDIRHLKVGSPLQKTISGGQRKRLNIALELLRAPDILFVDEPTSGLSSRDSENIMDLLKELSLRGKLIFVVIHQPSSDIFKMFDRLIILDTGGYQIYYGNPVEAAVYFKEAIQMVDREQGACPECGNVNPEQIFNIIEGKVVDEYGRLTDQRKVSPSHWNELYKQQQSLPDIKVKEDIPDHDLQLPGKIGQFIIFAARDFKSKLANRQYLLINLLEAPVLAALLAYVVRYADLQEHGAYFFRYNSNIPAYFFMSIIVALFMGLTGSAEEIIKDRKILKREAFLHLSRGSYLVSKILILFGFSAIQTLFFVLIGDFILEIDGMALEYWLILFSTSCLANLLGLNISSAFDSAITIYILIPLLLIPQLILSGVVVSFDHLNPNISTKARVPLIGEMMASRWAFEAAMVAQYKHNDFNKNFYSLDKTIANEDYHLVYYIPELQTLLSEVRTQADDESWQLIQLELGQRATQFGVDSLLPVLEKELSQLQAEDYQDIEQFLEVMNRVFQLRFNEASDQKDQRIQKFTKTPELKAKYLAMREHFHNEAITAAVRGTDKTQRILRTPQGLIQKIYPIYKEPKPRHFLDFREQFFIGSKYFAGYLFDTVYFNVLIIWLMSLILFIMLYFDLLRKIVTFRRK